MKKYAKVFVDRPEETLGLVLEVQVAVEARRRGVTVAGAHVEVDIRPNSDAGQAPGFLGFPVVAEVYPNDDCDLETFIAAVASLVSALDAAGYNYAAAASFEDRLPNHGRNVPIP